LSHEDILSYEEILRLVRIAVQLGISKVRITGGEPLVRKGACEFIQALHQVDGIRDVSLTTNGVLLKDNVDTLIAAGLHRINISLDTLNPEKFMKITGVDAFDRVWEGIQKRTGQGSNQLKSIPLLFGTSMTMNWKRLPVFPLPIRFISVSLNTCPSECQNRGWPITFICRKSS
jgi:MoaA/NifB/PqqE/SkfB family radical SAM enzyme